MTVKNNCKAFGDFKKLITVVVVTKPHFPEALESPATRYLERNQ